VPILDFCEIPPSNKGEASDSFELFARDFLAERGFAIVTGPDRGADGGKDIVVEEVRTGTIGESRISWLVSCKHYARSGVSVGVNDELNIQDRLHQFGCSGFLAFYSTLPSSALRTRLDQMAAEVAVYDRERIESELLSLPRLVTVAKRYFPESMSRWLRESPGAAEIFVEPGTVTCKRCGRDLLSPEPSGIAVVWRDQSRDTIHDYYCCCKGICDRELRAARAERGWVDSWEDITDIIIPTVFLRRIMTPVNQLGAGWQYTEDALKGLRDLLWAGFPRVARQLTTKEADRVRALIGLPWYLGGLGEDSG
jgi:hypothetical protein